MNWLKMMTKNRLIWCDRVTTKSRQKIEGKFLLFGGGRGCAGIGNKKCCCCYCYMRERARTWRPVARVCNVNDASDVTADV